MEEYEVIEMVGEGSFGRVYKARHRSQQNFVALKFIPKVGRTEYELQSLRQEFEIQKGLRHPNIVHMLGAFETVKELVVITEYVDSDLFNLLDDGRTLGEEKMRTVACQLLSALYYLHSHRILHRDIKPQNILITTQGVVKLCDFGFARTMDLNTYVLTSVKGTPLYMAPEIIEEKPYDHNADLWSLGCILYELMAGSPPFCTTSLLQLIRKIRYETIPWPDHWSAECLSLLQGLLEKDPRHRLTWPHLLQHDFLQGKVLVLSEQGDDLGPSLTTPLTASQELAKEIQRQNLSQRMPFKNKVFTRALQRLEEYERRRNSAPVSRPKVLTNPEAAHRSQYEITLGDWTRRQSAVESRQLQAVDRVSERQKMLESILRTTRWPTKNNVTVLEENTAFQNKPPELPPVENVTAMKESELKIQQETGLVGVENAWNQEMLTSEPKSLENEEWAEFLDGTLDDAMENPQSLLHRNLVAVVVAPLRNVNASPALVERIATLLAVPWVSVEQLSEETLIRTYADTRVVPNLLYACKVMVQRRSSNQWSTGTADAIAGVKNNGFELTADDLQALEMLLGLVCRLVHLSKSNEFMNQFCDAVCVLNTASSINRLLSIDRRKARIVSHILAILSHILRTNSENVSVVQDILIQEGTDLLRLLSHRNPLIRSRCCTLVGYLALRGTEQLKKLCKQANILEQIDQLLNDSESSVQQSAMFAYQAMQKL